MLTWLVVTFYSTLIELALWGFLACGGIVGYQLAKMAGGSSYAFWGAIGGVVVGFTISSVLFGGFLILDDIRRLILDIEKSGSADSSKSVRNFDNRNERSIKSGRGSHEEATETGADIASESRIDAARKHLQNPLTAEQYAEKYNVTVAQVEDFVTKRFLLCHSVAGQLYVADRRLPDHLLKPDPQ